MRFGANKSPSLIVRTFKHGSAKPLEVLLIFLKFSLVLTFRSKRSSTNADPNGSKGMVFLYYYLIYFDLYL